MIDNLFDVLYVAKTGKIKPDASLTDNLFGKKFYDAHSDIITTATGNPVSIITSKAQDAISTILSYSPKQSGTGDPSPSNVRPIEGWTGANATVAGKNLLDCTQPLVANPNGTGNDGLPFYPPAIGSYTIKPSKRGADNKRYAYLRGFIVHSDGTYEDYLAFSSSASYADYTARTFEITQNGDWIFLYAAASTSDPRNIARSEPQVELGSQATDYVPFITPSVYPVRWQTEAGTIFGGEVDFVRGKVRVTHAIVDMGTLDWNRTTTSLSYVGFYASVLDMYGGYPLADKMCSAYKVVNKIRTQLSDLELGVFNTNTEGSRKQIFLRDDSFAEYTADQVQTALSGVMLAYELATPIELPLTPQTVALLAGANTIWCDGDSLSVTYKAKKGV